VAPQHHGDGGRCGRRQEPGHLDDAGQGEPQADQRVLVHVLRHVEQRRDEIGVEEHRKLAAQEIGERRRRHGQGAAGGEGQGPRHDADDGHPPLEHRERHQPGEGRAGLGRRHLLHPDRHAEAEADGGHPAEPRHPAGFQHLARGEQRQGDAARHEGREQDFRVGGEAPRQDAVRDVENACGEAGGAPAPGEHRDAEQQEARQRDRQRPHQPRRRDAFAEQEEAQRDDRRRAHRVHVPHRDIGPSAPQPLPRLQQVEALVGVEHRRDEAHASRQERDQHHPAGAGDVREEPRQAARQLARAGEG
jgi:hypothetical protein